MGCFNVTGASGKASDYVAERHANQPSTEQATQRPAARSAGQGVLQGLQRQNSTSRPSDDESAIRHAVAQARAGEYAWAIYGRENASYIRRQPEN